MFNEKLDILGRKNQHHEFLESSVKYTQAIGDIVKALPTYKISPTKPYKFYLEATHGIHLKGNYSYCTYHYVPCRDSKVYTCILILYH